MLVPQFKLNYLEQSQRSIKRTLLVEAVKKMEVSEVVTTSNVQSAAVALNNPLNEISDTPDDLIQLHDIRKHRQANCRSGWRN